MNIRIKKCGLRIIITPEVKLDYPDLVKVHINEAYKEIDSWIERNSKIKLGNIEQHENIGEYHQICLHPNCHNTYIDEDGEEYPNITKCLKEHPNEVDVGVTTNIDFICNYISKRWKKYEEVCKNALSQHIRTLVI